MPDIIITPSTGKLEFVNNSAQNIRKHVFSMDDDGLSLDAPLAATSIKAPLNIINVNVDNSNTNYPFVLASGSAVTGIKTLMMDGAGGTYNPFTNIATIDISGNSATTTLASNSTQLGGVAAASYVTLTGTQTLTNKTITGTFTGNLTGTGSWATNAVSAVSATNSTQLNGQAASYYTDIVSRLGYTPVNQAGGTVTGNLTVNGNFSVNGSFTAFSASNVYISSSQLYIEDNILTLNAFSPYLRYAGVEMYDSGSGTLSSLLWDGEADYFFLTGSSVNGKIITGPDGQTNLTANFVAKATAGNKLGNSIIYDNGTSVGIGTTTVNQKVSIYPGTTGGISLQDIDSETRSYFFIDNTNGIFSTGIRTANYYLDFDSSGGAQNAIRFYTGTSTIGTGTERMRIISTGNVGIGTNTPGARLEISSSTAASLLNVKGAGGNGILYVSGSGVVGIGTTSISDGARLTIAGETRIASSAAYFTHLNYLDGGNNIISSANGGSTVFRGSSNNITAMTILGSGNVGIGTSSPTSKLHVVETTATGSRIQLGSSSTNALMNTNLVNDFLILTAPFNAVPASVSNNNAKWGIKMGGGSIDSPNALGKSACIYAVSEEDIGAGGSGAGYNRKVGLALHTSPFDLPNVERVRINNLGNVGIGVTSPRVLLDLAKANNIGQVLLLGETSANIRVGFGLNPSNAGMRIFSYNHISDGLIEFGGISSDGSTWTRNHRLGLAGGNSFFNEQGGNVGIGIAVPTAPLHVVGVISGSSFTGAGTGLTGTAASLSIGGTAATATTASYSLNTTLTTAATYPITSSWATNAVTALNVGNGTITIAGGTGVGVGSTNTFTTNQSGATTVTITNNGVTAITTNTGLSTNASATGAVTITNTGVTAITTNTGLSTNASATGAVTITNTGVTSITTNTGLSTNASATGAVTITNSSPNATHTGDVTGATALTIANDAVTTVKILNANVTNAKLANSSVTIGSTAVSLGGTVTTFAGLASVTSTAFVGALTGNVTGNVTGTAGSETFATVTGRGASTTTQISVGTTAGGSMYTGIKSGAGYSDAVSGATFKSITDHPTGGSYAFAAYFNGAPGTGTNSFFVAADGTGYFKGYVGIGTTAPQYPLDISGSNIRSFSTAGGAEPGFIADYPSSNGYGGFFIHVNNTRRWRIGSVGDTNVQPALNFWQEGTGSRMIITNTGNVGIGTTTVPSPLTVYNNSDVWHFRLGGASGELRMGGQTNSGAVIQSYTPGGTVRDLYLQRDGGNIGVGLNNPSSKIHIYENANRVTYITQNNNHTARFEAYGTATAIDTTASNGIFFRISGGDIVKFAADGNVGIGTSNATAKLESYYSSNAITFNYLATNLNNNSPIPVYGFDVTNGVGETRSIKAGIGYERHETNGRGTMHFYNDSTNDTQSLSGNRSSAGDIKMSINNVGNVGIGTTSPNAPLEVSAVSGDGFPAFKITSTSAPATFNYAVSMYNSSLGASKNYILMMGKAASSKNAGYIGYNHSGTDGSNTNFLTFGHFQSDNLLNLLGNGNVGIGSTAPNDKLDVVGRVYAYRYIAVSSNASLPAYATDTNTGMFNAATNQIGFSISSAEKVRIDTNGNVGIGTTVPGKKLDVEGVVRTRGATGTGGFEIGAATTGTAKWRIEWDSASDSLDFNWVG
jgi:hypothetical protein